MTRRDYLGEMNAAISAALAGPTPSGPESVFAEYAATIAPSVQPAPTLARDLVERLRATDPDLLTGWLQLRAADFIAMEANRRRRSAQARVRREQPVREFGAACAEWNRTRDPAVFAKWLSPAKRAELGIEG